MKSERCSACRHPVKREGREDDDPWCSEFCATVPEKDRKAWQTERHGAHCVYPCKVCGHAIEDMLAERVCSGCWPTTKLKRLLRQCVRHVPEALRVKIRAAVKA